jgi:hypothetical protein
MMGSIPGEYIMSGEMPVYLAPPVHLTRLQAESDLGCANLQRSGD